MGGNQVVFQDRIKHNHIDSTIDIIEHFILEPSKLNEWQLLGSQKKKEDSGDIDLGIDIKSNLNNNYSPLEQVNYSYNTILENTQKFFFNSDEKIDEYKQYIEKNKFIKKLAGLGIISISFPQINEKYNVINNNSESKIMWVQLDLIFGNLDFMKHYTDTLYEPDFIERIGEDDEEYQTTEYKSVLKNWLLLSQLTVLTTKDEGDNIKSKVTLTYNGFKKIYQEYTEDRNGKPKKKTIRHEYIDIPFLDFFKNLFKDDNISYNDLVSVENLVSYLKNNQYTRKHYKEILDTYKGYFERGNFDFPTIAEL